MIMITIIMTLQWYDIKQVISIKMYGIAIMMLTGNYQKSRKGHVMSKALQSTMVPSP